MSTALTTQPTTINPLVWICLGVVPPVLLYLLTMSNAITLADAGLFQMVCADNGIAHPPGYPLFTLVCHPFIALPFEGAIPGNLVSTFFAAATLTTLYGCTRLFRLQPLESAAICLAFGFGATFWSQSIVIEVYTLNAFLGCLMILMCLGFERWQQPVWLILAALFLALGMSNHWPLALLSAVACAPILLQNMNATRVALRPMVLVGVICAFAIGLSPYLLMLGKPDAYMTMIGPVSTFSDVLLYASRSTYEDASLPSISESLDYMWWLSLVSFDQWGPIGWLLIPLGLIRSLTELKWTHAASLLVLWVSHCLLLPLLSNYGYDDLPRYFYLTWTIPAHLCGAIWLFLGLRFLARQLPLSDGLRNALMIAVCIFPAVYNLGKMNTEDAQWVDAYNRIVLSSLPDSAILFVEGDNQTGPIGYLHHVIGVRPDIELRNRNNILFGNRLHDPRGFIDAQEQAIQSYVVEQNRPSFFIFEPPLTPLRDHGMYLEAGRSGFTTNPELDQYMQALIPVLSQDGIRDPVIRHYLHRVVYRYARSVMSLAVTSGRMDAGEIERLALVSSTLQGKTWALYQLVSAKRESVDLALLFSLIEEGENQISPTTTAFVAGDFLRLAGDAFADYGNDEAQALARYRRAQEFDLANQTCDYLKENSRDQYLEPLQCE